MHLDTKIECVGTFFGIAVTKELLIYKTKYQRTALQSSLSMI